jgi:glycosyltransferase involved in cell wall biosynthesis
VVGPRFGEAVWAPIAASPIPHRSVSAGRYPWFAVAVPALLRLIDGDLIYASKPRPTSFGLGLLARARHRRPLVLDIDDWEVGFFRRGGLGGTLGRALNLADPNGLSWTWLCERAVGAADAVTVASRFLERRFGGVFLTHVRDTEVWDPARHDGAATRARLGIGDRRLVMFLGTPRAYKGVDDLVDAVGRLGDRVALALVGADSASPAARRWAERPFVRLLGPVAFDAVPDYLAAADVVAVPQRATTDTVGQVPAKLIDAMAMARPVVATAVSMIPEILDGCGVVVTAGDVGGLSRAIAGLLDDPARAAALGARARARCVERYSFAAARNDLFPLVDRVLGSRRK